MHGIWTQDLKLDYKHANANRFSPVYNNKREIGLHSQITTS